MTIQLYFIFLSLILSSCIFSVEASFFSEYILGERERVLFAKTPAETVINPPEIVGVFPLTQTNPKKLSQLALDNGASRHKKRKVEVTRLSPDGRWNTFNFWESGAPANQEFHFRINEPHILDVTDYLCSGDAFSIVNLQTDEEEEIAVTRGRGAFDNCLTFASTPQLAWNSENFSHVRHLLAADNYKLQIVATQSPAGAGQGAVRLEPVRFSRSISGNLRLVESKLPWRFAAQVCDLYGMELAHLEGVDDAVQALKFVFTVLGQRETAFIAGFGDSHVDHFASEGSEEVNPDSFYIYTGKHRGEGQILSNSDATPPSSVLCREN